MLLIAISLVACYHQLCFANPTYTENNRHNIESENTISAGNIQITSNADRSAIECMQHSVASQERVNYMQPSQNSIILVNIIGPNVSTIEGQVSSNGRIIFSSPAGIVFAGTARLDVAGLIATTAQIKLDGEELNNFFTGTQTLHFEQGIIANSAFADSNYAGSIIVKHGAELTVKEGGLAAIVAPNVQNDGKIVAIAGKVKLATSAHQHSFYVDFISADAQGLINFTGPVSAKANNGKQDGKAKTEPYDVVNTGIIQAQMVAFEVAHIKGVLDYSLHIPGEMIASNISVKKGEVTLAGSIEDLQSTKELATAMAENPKKYLSKKTERLIKEMEQVKKNAEEAVKEFDEAQKQLLQAQKLIQEYNEAISRFGKEIAVQILEFLQDNEMHKAFRSKVENIGKQTGLDTRLIASLDKTDKEFLETLKIIRRIQKEIPLVRNNINVFIQTKDPENLQEYKSLDFKAINTEDLAGLQDSNARLEYLLKKTADEFELAQEKIKTTTAELTDFQEVQKSLVVALEKVGTTIEEIETTTEETRDTTTSTSGRPSFLSDIANHKKNNTTTKFKKIPRVNAMLSPKRQNKGTSQAMRPPVADIQKRIKVMGIKVASPCKTPPKKTTLPDSTPETIPCEKQMVNKLNVIIRDLRDTQTHLGKIKQAVEIITSVNKKIAPRINPDIKPVKSANKIAHPLAGDLGSLLAQVIASGTAKLKTTQPGKKTTVTVPAEQTLAEMAISARKLLHPYRDREHGSTAKIPTKPVPQSSDNEALIFYAEKLKEDSSKPLVGLEIPRQVTVRSMRLYRSEGNKVSLSPSKQTTSSTSTSKNTPDKGSLSPYRQSSYNSPHQRPHHRKTPLGRSDAVVRTLFQVTDEQSATTSSSHMNTTAPETNNKAPKDKDAAQNYKLPNLLNNFSLEETDRKLHSLFTTATLIDNKLNLDNFSLNDWNKFVLEGN